jgi:hypothetical protein
VHLPHRTKAARAVFMRVGELSSPPAMASTARPSSWPRKWHIRGRHRPSIITMPSVGQTVASRAYFFCAGELSRREQWRTAVPVVFSGRTPPLLLHLLIWVVQIWSDGPGRPVPLRGSFFERNPGFLWNRTLRARLDSKIRFSWFILIRK